jgi:hypothetical protein
MVTGLVPRGWLLFEEPDFGLWMGDAAPPNEELGVLRLR